MCFNVPITPAEKKVHSLFNHSELNPLPEDGTLLKQNCSFSPCSRAFALIGGTGHSHVTLNCHQLSETWWHSKASKHQPPPSTLHSSSVIDCWTKDPDAGGWSWSVLGGQPVRPNKSPPEWWQKGNLEKNVQFRLDTVGWPALPLVPFRGQDGCKVAKFFQFGGLQNNCCFSFFEFCEKNNGAIEWLATEACSNGPKSLLRFVSSSSGHPPKKLDTKAPTVPMGQCHCSGFVSSSSGHQNNLKVWRQSSHHVFTWGYLASTVTEVVSKMLLPWIQCHLCPAGLLNGSHSLSVSPCNIQCKFKSLCGNFSGI